MSTIGYYICVPFAWLVRLFYNLVPAWLEKAKANNRLALK